MASIIYSDRVRWYCQDCGEEGENDSQASAEGDAEAHECQGAEEGHDERVE
jgi:hypothetical protein